MTIKLLDCTLRDGGYLNNWEFGQSSMLNIFRRLVKSNIDIIEIGFLDDRESKNLNRSINPNTQCYNELYSNEKKNHTFITAMIDFGTCSIDNIAPKSETFIDAIRVIFKQPKMYDALKFCHKLKEKGYDVFVNPVSITTYSDRNMLDLIDLVNELEPYAMSLVDTYGLLHREKLFKYFYLLDNNLKSTISIGYHAHNNFQLAYSNAIELLNIKTKRNIVLDSSLYGMGKSAGNCNTELLANYLNSFYNKEYDISEILNIIELEILKYKKITDWGYQMTYYLAGANSCHPNYVQYLENKNMLRVQEINNILALIDEEHKLTFNKEYIEDLYLGYQQKNVDDSASIKMLSEELTNKTVLLLGPGVSVKNEFDKIEDYINKNDLILFSVNHINTLFNANYIFISNNKRYDQFMNNININKETKLILTSNIMTVATNDNELIINYSDLINKSSMIGQSALYLLINLLIKIGTKKVVLAGFDGFSKYTQNYYDSQLQFNDDKQNNDETTKAISEQIQKFSKLIKIEFLTKSRYEDKCVNNV